MSDVQKIAALAMLSLTSYEADCLRGDMAQILEMGDAMPRAEGDTHPGRAVGTDDLRTDTAAAPEGAGLLHLSKKARAGFIVVSRTVGGDV